MDEIKDEALNEGEQTPQVESPEPEQAPEEVEQIEAESINEAQNQSTETEEEPKRGYQSRVRELVKERNEERERRMSLEKRLAEITNPIGFSGNGEIPTYQPQQAEPIVRPGEEIDVYEFEKRLQAREQRLLQQATAQTQLITKQNEAVNRINNESRDVVRKYSQLDPDSDNFDRELSETITEATEAYVRQNPYTASVTKFVEKLMKPYTRSVNKEVGKVTENIAKQVSAAALRPTSVRKQEKSATEKSIAELEAELGVIQA